jgi:hypothetical protein
MAPKKVTRRERPKRKIVIFTIEIKKELITKWGSAIRLTDLPVNSNIPPTIIIDFYVCTFINKTFLKNSFAFSPQANYTDRNIQLLKLSILVLSLFTNMIFWNRHLECFILGKFLGSGTD